MGTGEFETFLTENKTKGEQQNMKRNTTRDLTVGALIAALFVALTALSSTLGLAIGPFELRLSEALCVLPALTPAAIPALFVGCVLSNLLCGGILLDVIFGSLATLAGAVGTFLLRKRPILSLVPPIVANTVVVPPLLYFAYGFREVALPLLFFSIFVGELLSAGVLGYFVRKCLSPLWKTIK